MGGLVNKGLSTPPKPPPLEDHKAAIAPSTSPPPVYRGSENRLLSSELCSEDARMLTFIEWPHRFIPIVELVSEGFYYWGESDFVRCVYCTAGIGEWKEGDIPSSRHRRISPWCPLVNNENIYNVKSSFVSLLKYPGGLYIELKLTNPERGIDC